METFIDWLLGRKYIHSEEGRGLGLAIRTINEFTDRTFKCVETTPKTAGIHRDEILELIRDELPVYYDYTTRVKRYLNKRGILQARIEIIGSIGLSNRYNPLDKTFHIATEAPRSSACSEGRAES